MERKAEWPCDEHVAPRPRSRRPAGWLRVIPAPERRVILEDDVTLVGRELPSTPCSPISGRGSSRTR